MVHVAAHLSLEDLAGRLRAARDARSARHVQAIWLLAKGHAMAAVSSTTAFGVRWIEKLLARYNAQGPDALGDLRRHNGTSRTILKRELLDSLREKRVRFVRSDKPDAADPPQCVRTTAGEDTLFVDLAIPC